MFLLTRAGVLNHCLMKPFVICQFEMFTFVVSHTMFPTYFFCKSENQIFGFLVGEYKREGLN